MAKKKVTELEEVQNTDMESTNIKVTEIVQTEMGDMQKLAAEQTEGTSELSLCETETGEQTEGDKGPENSAMEEAAPQTETEEGASVNALIPASPENADSEESHKTETATDKKSKK